MERSPRNGKVDPLLNSLYNMQLKQALMVSF